MNVAALVSGGVDSAVSVYQLLEQGIRPHLFYIKIGPDKDTEWNCTSEEDVEICRWLARKFDLPFDIVDLHREYWDMVVGYTMDKARQGLTPNPDVMCNKLIKFGCFEQQEARTSTSPPRDIMPPSPTKTDLFGFQPAQTPSKTRLISWHRLTIYK